MKKTFLLILSLVTLICSCHFNITKTSLINLETIENDTIHYHVNLHNERYERNEYIEVYRANKNYKADINVTSTVIKENLTRQVSLTEQQIDTLNRFSEYLKDDYVPYNIIGVAGRLGIYSVINKNDTLRSESKNLYSLTNALDID